MRRSKASEHQEQRGAGGRQAGRQDQRHRTGRAGRPAHAGRARHARRCREGVEPPRLYAQGFAHANCGGFCIKGGQGQFATLLRHNPGRYRYHERREQELREHLDADVAILRDRTGGKVRPLTLREFRERAERQPELVDFDEWGGCGCMGEAA